MGRRPRQESKSIVGRQRSPSYPRDRHDPLMLLAFIPYILRIGVASSGNAALALVNGAV